MLKDNLIMLRNINGYSQEEVAEKIGISRQAYAKWEKGSTIPDVERCANLAKIYGTTVDELMNYNTNQEGITVPPAPKGKHIFGMVVMNEKGQIVIPKAAREIMKWETGDRLIILGDEMEGLALMKAEIFEETIKKSMEMAKKRVDF